jgi:hypothetical protein
MKHSTLIFIFILIGGIFFSKCHDIRYNDKVPQNFSFKFRATTYEFDSKTGIYTRKYLDNDSSVMIILTKDEILKIYKAYKKVNFSGFPDTFKCSIFGTFTLPSFETTIEFRNMGASKSSTNTTYCSRKRQQAKSRRFDNLEQMMFEIIHSKPEVKNMRPCDMIFL